ncbi:toxin-antitoxin system YwqK family antitoxin [Salinimicrobium sp. WS361]|uniref:toxin-antitoxin system YwqK family antitoxin n=1 Tax=Salinimicrobium sp. WS361 TaxID=3425123 RepID=UPI003D6E4604
MRIILLFSFLIFTIGCSSQRTALSENEEVINYETGELKAKGHLANEYLPFYRLRAGQWQEYYKNGQEKSTGNYKVGKYTDCCTGGVCDGFYNYKAGEWIFFYENGQIKAKGKFDLDKYPLDTSCEGGDEILFSTIGENWVFYNEAGAKIEATEELIREIEETQTNGSFPETTFRVEKITGKVIRE